jgi:hypothetical protein
MIPNKVLGFINKITEVIPIKHWVICQGITEIKIEIIKQKHGYSAQEGARTTHSTMNQLKSQGYSFTRRRKDYRLIIREKCRDK